MDGTAQAPMECLFFDERDAIFHPSQEKLKSTGFRMPSTRRQTAAAKAATEAAKKPETVVFVPPVDDVARRLKRVSASLHCLATSGEAAEPERRSSWELFRAAGSKSAANARSLWHLHDNRHRDNNNNNDNNDKDYDTEEEDEEEESAEQEVRRSLSKPCFFYERAVELLIDIMRRAEEMTRQRQLEMRLFGDREGELALKSLADSYRDDAEPWKAMMDDLDICVHDFDRRCLNNCIPMGWI